MQVQSNFLFFSDATTSGSSRIFQNVGGDTLTVQVTGTAPNFEVHFQGRANTQADFMDVFGVAIGGDMDKMSATKVAKAPGLYSIDLSGLTQVRMVLTTISGGNVTVFGKVTSGVVYG